MHSLASALKSELLAEPCRYLPSTLFSVAWSVTPAAVRQNSSSGFIQTVVPFEISWNDPASDSFMVPVQPWLPATVRLNVTVWPESLAVPVTCTARAPTVPAVACCKIHPEVWAASGSTTAFGSSLTVSSAAELDGPQAETVTAREVTRRAPVARRRVRTTNHLRSER